MPNDKFGQRLSALYADMERLASHPEASSADLRRELAELRARLLELETQIKASAESADVTGINPSEARQFEIPSLYEKEQVGYTFAGERLEALRVDTLKELRDVDAIRTPLIETGRPVGSMVIEAPAQRTWNADEKELAAAVARQASLQIQNLHLLAAAERARAEAQAATHRFTHDSWDAYLDAIHQHERIGYAYDQAAVEPFLEKPQDEADFQAAVSVMEAEIGHLFLKPNPERPLTDQDKSMVAAVARQVGQQVENLRLLADAARARATAEETTRLLSRENWKNYVADHLEANFGFVYDSNQVLPLDESHIVESTLTQPLAVQGQPIGQLALTGLENLSESDQVLFAAIAARASTHLETLRLNDELRKRAAELQELDRLKSSFLANMSHELRTPLNSILGFSDVMLEEIDGPLTEYMANDLRLIQKNGQHLLHLINDVLDMAKIESGRMNLHPEKFKIQDLFDEVISITSTLANSKNLALFIEPSSDQEIEIFADNTRLRQIMINLVNNSIKFTETGQVTMQAALLGSDKILIMVKDTGLGIPADHLETIFQEFSQVDTSTTRKVGGTGLGLPISRRLVEMHGGRLWAESAGVAGEGTTMSVELPRETIITEPIEKTAK